MNDSCGHAALIEHGDREAVTNADEVAEIDERVEARNLALLRQPAQESLGGAAVARRLDPEGAECTSPGGDAGELREGPVADPFERALLLVAEELPELRLRAAVDDATSVQDAAHDGREAVEYGLGVREHGTVRTSSRA